MSWMKGTDDDDGLKKVPWNNVTEQGYGNWLYSVKDKLKCFSDWDYSSAFQIISYSWIWALAFSLSNPHAEIVGMVMIWFKYRFRGHEERHNVFPLLRLISTCQVDEWVVVFGKTRNSRDGSCNWTSEEEVWMLLSPSGEVIRVCVFVGANPFD